MKNFVQRLNFSNAPRSNAIKIMKWHNINYFETLCLYCSEQDINTDMITAADFMSAVQIMSEYGQCDYSDSYYFWID